MKRMFSKSTSTGPVEKSTRTQNSIEPTVNPLVSNELPSLNEPARETRAEASSAAELAPFREPAMASSGFATEREPYIASTGNAQLRNYFFSEKPAWNQSLPAPPEPPARQRAEDFFRTKAIREKNIIGRGGRRTRKRKHRKNKK